MSLAGNGCAPASAGLPLTPPAPPTLALPLINGQRVLLTIDAGILDVLPAGWALTLGFDPRPIPPYDSIASALHGAHASQAGVPFHLRVEVIDCATGASLPLPESLLDYPVQLSLPALSPAAALTAPADLDVQFAWFRALWDADTFAGYLRINTAYEGASGALVFNAALADVQSALFLPALVTPSYVQNVDAEAHIWSGPMADVGVGPDADIGATTTNETIDFGLAAERQFTTFTIVGPQIGERLFVANTATGAYGWIDAAAVGPSGPPRL